MSQDDRPFDDGGDPQLGSSWDWLAEEVDDSSVDIGEEESDTLPAGLGYNYRIRIADVVLSPNDCPDCLCDEAFNCDECSFFAPETCLLLRRPDLMAEYGAIFHMYREHFLSVFTRRDTLLPAAESELRAHGHPLHYSVLAQMLRRRYAVQVSDGVISRLLASNPGVFERVGDGVYRRRGSH